MSSKDYMSSAGIFAENVSALWIKLSLLPNKRATMDGAFSDDDVEKLFRDMPDNFAVTHSEIFNMAADLSINQFTFSKERRLNIILHSPPMLWLRDHNPVACAEVLPELLKKLGPKNKKKCEFVTFFLSGEFTKNLLQAHPKDCLKMAHQLWSQLEEDEIEQLLSPQIIATSPSSILRSNGVSLEAKQHAILLTPKAGINLPPLLQLATIPCDETQAVHARCEIKILTPDLKTQYGLGTQQPAANLKMR